MGVILLFGFVLIIYIALGLVYWQQTSRQKELAGQIANLNATLSRPLPSAEKLQAEYQRINAFLPLTVPAALDIIAGIAKKSGIDTAPDAGKFSIPPGSITISSVKVGISDYQLLSFKNIKAQGDDNKVMAFVSALDSGIFYYPEITKRETMVLRGVDVVEEVINGGAGDNITQTTVTLEVDIYTKPVK
ncbi:MAG: hypothetical protein HY528_03865 [Chloroflexi bacterium]|nr:hypothetical protein [Chloroflexota bacterium]